MGIGHQEAMLAYDGLEFIFCAAVYGYTFPYGGVVADLRGGFFTHKFQVLRHAANHSAGKYLAAHTNATVRHDHRVGHNMAIIANHHVVVNHGKRLDSYVASYFCGRMY